LTGFALTTIGVVHGASLPRWRLEALDAKGNILANTGELEFNKEPLPRTYWLRADGIAAVRLSSDNRGAGEPFATFGEPPIVEMILERPVE
jgi:hypothetical protein